MRNIFVMVSNNFVSDQIQTSESVSTTITNKAKEEVLRQLEGKTELVDSKVNDFEVSSKSISYNSTDRYVYYTFSPQYGFKNGLTYNISFTIDVPGNNTPYYLFAIYKIDNNVWTQIGPPIDGYRFQAPRSAGTGFYDLAKGTAGIVIDPSKISASNTYGIRIFGTDVTTLHSLTVDHTEKMEVPVSAPTDGAIKSKIQQLYDMVSMAVYGQQGVLSQVAAGADGIYIRGETIRLDGKTVMDDAFAHNLFADTVTASSVSAFSATFSNVIAQNLDVNKISGNRGEFVSLGLKARYSYMDLTGNGLEIGDYNGNWMARHDRYGINFFNAGLKVSSLENVPDADLDYRSITTLVAETAGNGAVALSYRPGTTGPSYRCLWVGNEGDIHTSGTFLYGSTTQGLMYYSQKITDEGTGLAISAKGQSCAIAFVNNKLWYRTSAHGWRDLDNWIT